MIKNSICIVKYPYMFRCIYIIFREFLIVLCTLKLNLRITPIRHFHILSIVFTDTNLTTSMYCNYRVYHSLPNPALKILQRNLNRSTFVLREMKRNVSVVRLIVATRSSGQPASGKIIKEMPGSVASGTSYITI
jgi:hypothetical protein